MDQASPATPWEKVIGTLMNRMAVECGLALGQKASYEAQKIRSDNVPVISFAVPRLSVAVSMRVTGVVQVPSRPPILWNADAVGVSR